MLSVGDNLHEMSNHVFLENLEIKYRLSIAELAQRVVKIVHTSRFGKEPVSLIVVGLLILFVSLVDCALRL